jgi:hypothetical protein
MHQTAAQDAQKSSMGALQRHALARPKQQQQQQQLFPTARITHAKRSTSASCRSDKFENLNLN